MKHVAHVCDAGRVESQQLVERGRALHRVGSALVWWRCAGGVRGVWRRYRARCVLWDIVREIGAYSAVKWELGGGPNCEDAAGGTGHVCAGTHVKHPLHVRDAGGIPVGDVLVDPYL